MMNEKISLRILLNQNNNVKLDFFGYNKDNIHIISDNDIDIFAERLLRKYNNIFKLGQEIKPINIDKLIEFVCNKKLIYCNLSASRQTFGLTARIDGKIDIYDDNSNIIPFYLKQGDICIDEIACNSQHRIRFTLAHELCHSLIHSGISILNSKNNFIDNNKTFETWKINTPSGWMEHHANVFAASILMPKKLVFRLWKKFFKKNRLSINETKNQFINEVVDVFDVSPEAALIRLKKLKIL